MDQHQAVLDLAAEIERTEQTLRTDGHRSQTIREWNAGYLKGLRHALGLLTVDLRERNDDRHRSTP